MKIPDNNDLAEAVLSGAAQLDSIPPRTCLLCGRRMVVKINPFHGEAACSRHGLLRSEWLEK